MDLNTCLEESVALLRPEIERRNVMLAVSLSHGLRKAEADQQQIQDVFCNVIENALDAMPDGGTLTIRSHGIEARPAEKTSDWLVVDIADTGQGIAAEHRAKIFQPFFTTKKAGRGTGLGLAITFETVRSHGGQILVESEPGKGTRFRVLLPVSGGALQ